MKNKIIRIILCLLILAFLAVAAFILVGDLSQRSDYKKNIEQTLYAAENPDDAELKAAKEEKRSLQQQLDEAGKKLSELESAIATQTESNAELQQEYAQQAEVMDADYYNKILESLGEGVSLVEEHLK